MREFSPYAPKIGIGGLGPNVPPGDPSALSEAGSIVLIPGQQDYDVAFDTPKTPGAYSIDASISIPAGAVSQTFQWVTSNETVTGFRITLNAEPVAPNVGNAMPILNWSVEVL